jgi:release factor glutamine methyltransferase
VDVGTGSGAVAVSVAVALRKRRYDPFVRMTATDRSPDALRLAVENAVGHGVADLVDFREADLLDPAAGPGGPIAPADLVVANLPYVPTAVVPELPVAASFEPVAALDGGADGLDVVRRLLAAAPRVLKPDGEALLEIGSEQAEGVREAVESRLPGWQVEIHDDLSGRPRVASVRAPVAAA